MKVLGHLGHLSKDTWKESQITGTLENPTGCTMWYVAFLRLGDKVNMVFQWAGKSRREVRWSGPVAQPTDGLLEVPFPPTSPYPISSLVLKTASQAMTTPIHLQPIPLTCFPNRSNSVLPVLSKYRIFLESLTSLCRSNSSLAYLFISSLVEGGIL